MKYLKTFQESISGTEITVPFGPAYGRPNFPYTGSKLKLSHGLRKSSSTNELTDDIYTSDDFNQLYQDYLKAGGKPLPDGYTSENIDKIVSFLDNLS